MAQSCLVQVGAWSRLAQAPGMPWHAPFALPWLGLPDLVWPEFTWLWSDLVLNDQTGPWLSQAYGDYFLI